MFLTVTLFAIPFVIALLLSWHRALGGFRTSALNPLLLLATVVLLTGADFAHLIVTGRGQLAQNWVSASPATLVTLQLKYVCMLVAALGGIATAFQLTSAVKRAEKPLVRADIRFVAMAIYLIILAGWTLALLSLGVDVRSLADTVTIKAESTGVGPLFIFSILLLPALTYALARQPLRLVVPVVAVSILVLLASGSRTRIVYVLVPFVFYLVRVRGIRIPRHYFAIGLAVVGLLSIVAVNYRIAVSYNQQISLESLVSSGNVLNSNDVAFAETNLALSNMKRRQVEGFLGEDILGFFLAPIPRSVMPIKPFTGSIQFTKVYDEYHYTRFHRGLTIGAFNEIEYDYPFPLALVVIYLIGAVWGWAFARAAAARSIHGFAMTVALYAMLYVFCRSDLESIGQIAWAFAIYWVVIEPCRRIKATVAPMRVTERRRGPFSATPQPSPPLTRGVEPAW
jgi:hypothetical protein